MPPSPNLRTMRYRLDVFTTRALDDLCLLEHIVYVRTRQCLRLRLTGFATKTTKLTKNTHRASYPETRVARTTCGMDYAARVRKRNRLLPALADVVPRNSWLAHRA